MIFAYLCDLVYAMLDYLSNLFEARFPYLSNVMLKMSGALCALINVLMLKMNGALCALMFHNNLDDDLTTNEVSNNTSRWIADTGAQNHNTLNEALLHNLTINHVDVGSLGGD
ncbi:hypothetical protein ACH5RR_000564 [Cinchona calisaya]|uniref:Uncharacterized protein n=1 Tax=Cinchona calisaya TaxID=153742 RepID=A0ABD3B1P9_9GENT